mgnify:CR=1 FL=1
MENDISLHELGGDTLDWVYYAVIGGAVAMTLAIILIGPLLTGEDNAHYLGLVILGFEAILLLGGLAWFGVLLLKGRTPKHPPHI